MLVGFVDYASELTVRGWVCDTDTPNEHLTVHIYLNGEKITEAKADMYRGDIEAAGISDGWCGFSFTFPLEMSGASMETVGVSAVDARGALFPLKIVLPPADEAAAPQEFRSPLLQDDDEAAPIFVLGAARSGTSAVARALNYCLAHEDMPEEGHYLHILSNLSTTVASFYEAEGEEAIRNTLVRRIPVAQTITAIEQAIKNLVQSVMAAPVWVDKTPNSKMLVMAPKLLRIWPKARFVFARRRALDNLASRKRHFPDFNLLEHCQDWTNIMKRWRSLRELLGDSCFEVDQYDLMTNNAAAITKLCQFLNLSQCESAMFSLSLQLFQPQRTIYEWGKVESLESLDWSSAEKDLLVRICGPEMEAYGYSYDESYFSKITKT